MIFIYKAIVVSYLAPSFTLSSPSTRLAAMNLCRVNHHSHLNNVKEGGGTVLTMRRASCPGPSSRRPARSSCVTGSLCPRGLRRVGRAASVNDSSSGTLALMNLSFSTNSIHSSSQSSKKRTGQKGISGGILLAVLISFVHLQLRGLCSVDFHPRRYFLSPFSRRCFLPLKGNLSLAVEERTKERARKIGAQV